MKRSEQKRIIQILRRYLALGIAEKNMKEKIAAEEQLVMSMRLAEEPAKGRTDGTAERDALFLSPCKEHMFAIDRYRSELSVIRAERRAVDRCLAAMDREEKRILTAFYLKNYTVKTPFELMEQLGYEKSALYRARQKALNSFACCYDGYAEKR